MLKIIVVENPKNWHLQVSGVEVVSTKNYLTNPSFGEHSHIKVFNFCKDYSYQSGGYYVSLLAEARGHKAIPSVKTIQDLKAPAIVKVVSDELDELVQSSLKKIKSREFILSIYFGQNVAKHYGRLSYELYKLFRAPFLRARFVYNKKWSIQSIKPISLKDIPESHLPFVQEGAEIYFAKKRYDSGNEDKYIYDLAILTNPNEESPPSDKKAIQKFINAAQNQGFSVELITRDDYNRVGEFDALFIRETTAVNHHTYRFARRAQSDGLVVIDDPESILRCTNKVYLAELLSRARISTPPTMIVHSDNKDQVTSILGLPCVLKLPDSSFSQGVKKIKTEEQLKEELHTMFNQSDLIIAQKYMPTDFDWRVGILDGKVLYVCKYFMAKDHWQIYNWAGKKTDEIEGNFECLHPDDTPLEVINTALRAAKLIGNGLYGVDLKQIGHKVYVIEVNDNPSIDFGIEDQVAQDELYNNIVHSIRNRILEKARRPNGRS